MGAVGRDRIISLCCATVSIILTSIHSGPRGVSLPATRQTIPSPTNNKWTRDLSRPPTCPKAPDTYCSSAGPSAPRQVRPASPYWFHKDELVAPPFRDIAADAIDCRELTGDIVTSAASFFYLFFFFPRQVGLLTSERFQLRSWKLWRRSCGFLLRTTGHCWWCGRGDLCCCMYGIEEQMSVMLIWK